MGKGPEWAFVQRQHTNGQQVHEMRINITYQQGNENQNHDKISPHTVRMAIIKK